MDKETLSNYGWIVICVLVLSVMIALATPFGTYIEQGVWSATEGLFDTNNSAMGTVVTYSITDGAGQTINPTTATELTFRANMDISKFKGVKIDGATVDKANYTASDNTVILFTTDYIRTLSLGTHTIEILADIGSAKADFKAADGWEVPEGCTYYVHVPYGNKPGDYTGATAVYNAGEFVRTAAKGYDVFVSADYEYSYISGNDGWSVAVLDKTKTEYGAILENINELPVTSMHNTFQYCTALTTAPTIPSSVTYLRNVFLGCTSLKTAPAIPSGVTYMQSAFSGCTSLKTYVGSTDADGDFSNYVIPSGVIYMEQTFRECTLLTTAPTIPNSVKDMAYTFQGCSVLETAPVIPNSVTNMKGTFYDCTALTTAPTIPNSVTNMQSTFSGCTALTTAPVIPNSVTDMSRTFGECKNLTTAPIIPSSVTDMNYTFYYCTSLTGDIEINSTPTRYSSCLYGTQITSISGDCTIKDEILATRGY